MPVTYNAQVFPRFFSANKSAGVAFLPPEMKFQKVEQGKTFSLYGSLCFMVQGKGTSCIPLLNQSFAHLSSEITGKFAIQSNVTILHGWWPPTTWAMNLTDYPQPRMAPFCKGDPDVNMPLPWTGCQRQVAGWVKQNTPLFTFSPYMGGKGNFIVNDPWSFDGDPFDLWVLCGVNGSCTDITPFAFLLGGGTEKGSMTYYYGGNLIYKRNPQQTTTIKFSPTPVCVWPPFMWIVSNSTDNIILNCSISFCAYASCWNASQFPLAIVTRMPRFVPMPVQSPSSLTLFRFKRDLGISAAIISIITAAAVAASLTVSSLALSGTVQTASVVNNLSASVSEALDYQFSANTQIQGGLSIVNQRIDLVQEQVDVLWQLAQLGCEYKLPGLCVTSIQYDNFTRAANLSKALSRYMLQNWTQGFERTLRELRLSITQINSTRLDLSLTEGLLTWISNAFSFFKEWVGVGLFGAVLCCGLVLLFWLVYRNTIRAKREKLIIANALAALEQGATSDIWLSMLKQ